MLEMRPVAARGVVMATATLVLLLLLPMTGATADKIPLGESAITCLIAYYIRAMGQITHVYAAFGQSTCSGMLHCQLLFTLFFLTFY